LSAVEALAQLGGLKTNLSDPTGIFVLRDEHSSVANNVLKRTDLKENQRMVYVLNLSKPNGIFMARGFKVRNNGTNYVTEAPFTQWSKKIIALTGSLNAVNTINPTATGAGN
jgi:polysaccharide export outer membrane protein